MLEKSIKKLICYKILRWEENVNWTKKEINEIETKNSALRILKYKRGAVCFPPPLHIFQFPFPFSSNPILSLSLPLPEISDFEFVSYIAVPSITRRIKSIWSDFLLTDFDLWFLKMENLISLVNKIQRACTALGDHGEASALPTLWGSLPAIAVVGGQVCFRSLSSSFFSLLFHLTVLAPNSSTLV